MGREVAAATERATEEASVAAAALPDGTVFHCQATGICVALSSGSDHDSAGVERMVATSSFDLDGVGFAGD